MPDFSLAEGFTEVHESLTEMITHVANEPSVGLFFVQQHTHNSAPRLSSIKNKLVSTSQEVFLCSEDMDDALSSVKSLKECGPSIIGQMIKNLDSSVSMMSSLHQLRRNGGKLDQSNLSCKSNTIRAVWDSALQRAGNSHWRTHASGLSQTRQYNRESSSTTNLNYEEPLAGSSGMNPAASNRYLRPLKSVLQRVGNLGWRRATVDCRRDNGVGMLQRSYSAEDLKVIIGSGGQANSEYAKNDIAIFTSEAAEEESSVLSKADGDNGKEMDGDDQLPLSSQALFQSDDNSEIQVFGTAQADQHQILRF